MAEIFCLNGTKLQPTTGHISYTSGMRVLEAAPGSATCDGRRFQEPKLIFLSPWHNMWTEITPFQYAGKSMPSLSLGPILQSLVYYLLPHPLALVGALSHLPTLKEYRWSCRPPKAVCTHLSAPTSDGDGG